MEVTTTTTDLNGNAIDLPSELTLQGGEGFIQADPSIEAKIEQHVPVPTTTIEQDGNVIDAPTDLPLQGGEEGSTQADPDIELEIVQEVHTKQVRRQVRSGWELAEEEDDAPDLVPVTEDAAPESEPVETKIEVKAVMEVLEDVDAVEAAADALEDALEVSEDLAELTPEVLKESELNIVWAMAMPGSPGESQYRRMAIKLGFHHVDVAELLKQEITGGTQIGLQIQKCLEDHNPMPPRVLVELVLSDLLAQVEESDQKNFLISGFPLDLSCWHEWKRARVSTIRTPTAVWFETTTNAAKQALKKRGKKSKQINKKLDAYNKRVRTIISSFCMEGCVFRFECKGAEPADGALYPKFEQLLGKIRTEPVVAGSTHAPLVGVRLELRCMNLPEELMKYDSKIQLSVYAKVGSSFSRIQQVGARGNDRMNPRFPYITVPLVPAYRRLRLRFSLSRPGSDGEKPTTTLIASTAIDLTSFRDRPEKHSWTYSLTNGNDEAIGELLQQSITQLQVGVKIADNHMQQEGLPPFFEP